MSGMHMIPALPPETPAPPGPAGDVVVLNQPDHTLILLHGEIDLRCTDDLEYAGRYAMMDVRKVTQIDSVGVSFIIRLAAALRGAGTELMLRGPGPRVAELITLVGADELVRWESGEDDPAVG